MCSIANYCPKPSIGHQSWNPNLRHNHGFHGYVTPISSSSTTTSSSSSSLSSSFSKVSASNPNNGYTRVSESLVFPSVHRPRTPPRGIIHFIGGAFIGAVPEATYRLFIELLNQQDFVVIATPYDVTFEHIVAAESVYRKFQQCRTSLINGETSLPNLSPEDIAKLPIFSVGHSNGALLQLLIGCIIPDGLPLANAVISFNNKPAADAVPYFEQLGPITAQLAPVIATTPLANITKSFSGDSFNGLFERATPVLLPQYDKESLQSLQRFVDQIPKVLDQVTSGISEFSPSPSENRKAIESQYSVQNTLLVKYSVDAIDESDIIEEILKPRIGMINGSIEKITINGNHITPCVQDIKWEVGKVYTPVDAVGQVFRTFALTEIRDTITNVSNWFDKFV